MDSLQIGLIVLCGILAIATLVCVIIISKKNVGSLGGESYKILREDLERNMKNVREEMANSLQRTRQEINIVLGGRITDFSRTNEEKLEAIRQTVEQKLTELQRDNSEKIEVMRLTVDEKLHDTLEKRLGESFKLVNDRLESVYKGLGEMQSLAVGVGDLKKVLTNVKSRGSWGEIHLESILEEYLTPEQYIKNAKLKTNSKDFVEFAVKIPSKVDGKTVMLPIDSKFPIEDYGRLVEAEEKGDVLLVQTYKKELEKSVKAYARTIRDKYIDPPYTTDFAVMFLPTESLFCEVLKNASLAESVQRDYRVTITGPTTLTAFINSLQLGFHALAIEKQTSEVWRILANVKTEFNKFGDILSKTKKKIQEVANTMEDAESKTRNIQRKLGKVDSLAYGTDLIEDFSSDQVNGNFDE